MDNNLTVIAFVLDRSGSMSSIKQNTIEGFNKFLSEQKVGPDRCLFTLVQFDHEYTVVHDLQPIQNVPLLTDETFIPRGHTALYDAIGETIDSLGKKLAAMPEATRPARVIFVTLTDGHENASSKYGVGQSLYNQNLGFRWNAPLVPLNQHINIKDMIKHQTDKYNWQFLFLGANMDAILSGGQIGISAGKSVTFNTNKASMDMLFALNSTKVANYRCTNKVDDLNYSVQDRQAIDVK